MPSNPINKDTEGAIDSVCIKRVSIKQGWTVVHKMLISLSLTDDMLSDEKNGLKRI